MAHSPSSSIRRRTACTLKRRCWQCCWGRRREVMSQTIVLVYSGGLDTSVCIPMLREEYGYDRIVTVTVDVGQPPEDVRQAEEKARALGTEHTTVDAKQTFVQDYCWPAVRANG